LSAKRPHYVHPHHLFGIVAHLDQVRDNPRIIELSERCRCMVTDDRVLRRAAQVAVEHVDQADHVAVVLQRVDPRDLGVDLPPLKKQPELHPNDDSCRSRNVSRTVGHSATLRGHSGTLAQPTIGAPNEGKSD
jgi:hypothetical protein